MPAPDGRRLGLLVAGSKYLDPTLQRLRAPGADISGLSEVLSDPNIGGFEISKLIDNNVHELRRNIEYFCAGVGPNDVILVYLSCHGVLDSRNQLYYAALDTERPYLASTAISASWLNERLEECRSRRQLLILDCCHSGAFTRGAKGAKGSSELGLQDRFGRRGRVVLTASRGTEYSFEGADVVGDGIRSVFTQAVTEGLRTGDADHDRDGLITIGELYSYVYGAVRTREPRQTPEIWTYGGEGDFLVARSPREPEPSPVPEYLRVALESPRPKIRQAAVGELVDLLGHDDASQREMARRLLQRVGNEDIPEIASLARSEVAAEQLMVGAGVEGVREVERQEPIARTWQRESGSQSGIRRYALIYLVPFCMSLTLLLSRNSRMRFNALQCALIDAFIIATLVVEVIYEAIRYPSADEASDETTFASSVTLFLIPILLRLYCMGFLLFSREPRIVVLSRIVDRLLGRQTEL